MPAGLAASRLTRLKPASAPSAAMMMFTAGAASVVARAWASSAAEVACLSNCATLSLAAIALSFALAAPWRALLGVCGV